MRPDYALLTRAAQLEFVSLAVLLANLATVHWGPITSAIGPVHGCSYLLVIIAAAMAEQAPRKTLLTAIIPGIGGLLALRLTRRHRTDGRQAADAEQH